MSRPADRIRHIVYPNGSGTLSTRQDPAHCLQHESDSRFAGAYWLTLVVLVQLIFNSSNSRIDLQSALMYDSLLVFSQGVTKMDFNQAFHHGGNNVSCKHEQVQQRVSAEQSSFLN